MEDVDKTAIANQKQALKRDFLFALFIASMVIVNVLGTKITTIAGVRVSVGIFFMPLLFLITDIVGEVYGRKEATLFVNYGTIMLVFLFLMMNLCIAVKPNESWHLQPEYKAVFIVAKDDTCKSHKLCNIAACGCVSLRLLEKSHQRQAPMDTQQRLHHHKPALRHHTVRFHRFLAHKRNLHRRLPIHHHNPLLALQGRIRTA